MSNKKLQTEHVWSQLVSPSAAILATVVVVASVFYNKKNHHPSYYSFLPHDECWNLQIPTASCIVKGIPWLIASVVGLLVWTLVHSLEQAAPEVLQRQSARRHEHVQDMVQELEECFSLTRGEETNTMRLEDLSSRIVDLMEIPHYDGSIVRKGLFWAFKLYEMELKEAIEKTKQGTFIEYSSGKKLDELVYDEYPRLMARATEAKCVPENRSKLWNLTLQGRKLLRSQGIKGIVKAVKMLGVARTALGWVCLQTLATAASAMVTAASWYYRAQVLEHLQQGASQEFWDASKAMALVELLATFLTLLTNVISMRGDKMVAHQVQVSLFRSLMKMDLSWWASQSMDLNPWDEEAIHADRLLLLEYQVTEFLELPQRIISNLTTIASHAFLIANTSSTLLYILLAVNFAALILSWILSETSRRLRIVAERGLVRPTEDDFTWEHALEPTYISTFQSFVRGEKEYQSFASFNLSNIQLDRRNAAVDAIRSPVLSFVTQVSNISQMSKTADKVSHGLGLAEADAMLRSSAQVSQTTNDTWDVVKHAIELARPLARAYDLCNLPRAIDPDTGLVPSGRAKGHIEFVNVEFSYPERSNKVLKGVTFNVKPSWTVGLVGGAGCGKSTIFRLLERFYDVTSGSITLDGVNLREYNPRWLRRQIVTVAQEPVLLPITIRENLTFGCAREPSLDEIHEACQAANIYDVLMDRGKFPSGIRTELGVVPNISVGERQRIAIARAMLTDPPILLLDEAVYQEKDVQEAIGRLMEKRTTIVISGRQSTIQNANMVICLDNGKVLQSGSHEDLLLDTESSYAKLWEQKTAAGVIKRQPIPSTGSTKMALSVSSAMNPPLSIHTRLDMLKHRLGSVSLDSEQQAELTSITEELQREAVQVQTEQEHVRRSRQCSLKEKSVSRWKAQVDRNQTRKGQPSRLRKSVNRIMFRNMHSKVSNSLQDVTI